ncbi:uncharacterized protein LOC114355281 [Ostrinia furnacalis]|uniref:uncharacterized protein LOC114355281 n=1 Tax=Ostrinia furnacalis TaxID=93504 RepID=UPI0010395A2C|nr:uncharacterized protein LOC114355281 [Ostrinia furnacalis]
MSTLADVHQLQTSLEESLHKRMSEFEAQFKQSASEPTTLGQLYSEFRAFKESVVGIVQLLRSQIAELSRATDALEMRHRRKNLLFGGIPEDTKEDAPAVICDILRSRFNMPDVTKSVLKACHRLGSNREGRPRPILVRFADHTTKSAVWKKKTALKGTPTVISEFLTRSRQTLFLEARRRYGMTNVWTLDGNIYAKLADGKRCLITSLGDLDPTANVNHPVPAAREGSSAPAARSASSTSTSSSSTKIIGTRRQAARK